MIAEKLGIHGGLVWQSDAVWWKPWTYFDGHYVSFSELVRRLK